jgi:hypothetical protein
MVTLLIMSFFLSSKRFFVDVIKITERETLRVPGDQKGAIICLCTESEVFRCILKVLDDCVSLSKNGRVK